MTVLPTLDIDGSRFDDLEGFWDEISRQLIPGAHWGRNLDALNDILRGGFGTPDEGFVLRWLNSALSQDALGYGETVRWLEQEVKRCYPSNIPALQAILAEARSCQGPTLFDIIVEIIRAHGKGGEEEEDTVELQLA
jgi:RNAse (barnase) inhibitor barstar